MSLPRPRSLDISERPIRRAVRRLRWFRSSFIEQATAISEATGVRLKIDEVALAAAFVDWLRAFEAQKPPTVTARRPFVGFAAGLMLESLIRHKPVVADRVPEGTDLTNPAFFWPEGYVYVAYCLNVRAAVLEQDFDERRQLAPELGEIRVWWSFRENSEADASLATAFLDLFSGELPDWSRPAVFHAGRPGLLDATAPRRGSEEGRG